MAIKWIGQEWCPDARDYRREFVCDTNADLSKLPAAPYGSTAMVAASGKTCIVNASGQWIDTETGKVIPGAGVSNAPTGGNSGSSGGSSGGSGVSHWNDLEGRPFYDTRETVVDEYEVTGQANARNYIKVSDSVGFDFDKPMVFTPEYDGEKYSFDVVWGRTSPEAPMMMWGVDAGGVGGDYCLGVYIANEADAEWVWDSDDPNPFTTGLYCTYFANPYETRTIKYSFTYPSGELKTLDIKFMPDNYYYEFDVVPDPVTGDTDGTAYHWGEIKISDTLDFDFAKVDTISGTIRNPENPSGEYREVWKDAPVQVGRINGDGNSPLCLLDKNGSGWAYFIYIANQTEADWWFDGEGDVNPYTPGLYMCVELDSGIEAIAEYTFNFKTETEVKKIDPKFLPDGLPSATEGLVPVIEKKTLDFTNTNYQNASALPQLVPGETYVVDWNGTLYECVANMNATSGGDAYIGIGNWAAMGNWFANNWGNTGEPFVYSQCRPSYVSSLDVYISASWNTYEGAGIVEAGIYQKGTVVTKVNPKCMPDGYPGYEVVDTEVMNFTNADADDRGNLPTDFMPSIGDKFTVVYNGETYETECRASRHYDGDVVCIGDPSIINGHYPTTMEPFAIMFPLWESDYTKVQVCNYDSEWSVRVIYHKRIYTTMDSRYIAKEWPHSTREFLITDLVTRMGQRFGSWDFKVTDALDVDPMTISHITCLATSGGHMMDNEPVTVRTYNMASDGAIYYSYSSIPRNTEIGRYYPTDEIAARAIGNEQATAGLYLDCINLKEVSEAEFTVGITCTRGEVIKLPADCLPDANLPYYYGYDIALRFHGNDEDFTNGDLWAFAKGSVDVLLSTVASRGYVKVLIVGNYFSAEPYLVSRENGYVYLYVYCYVGDAIKHYKFHFDNSGTFGHVFVEEVTA